MEVVSSFAQDVAVQTATWRIDSEETVGGALRSVRPRRLDCVVGCVRVFSGSRCSGLRTSAQERRKWGREEGKPCIAVGSDGGVECCPPGFVEGAEVAPGTLATLHALTDPEKRPPLPRSPIPEELIDPQPRVLFNLYEDTVATNLRSARRGAAGCLSVMTAEHLRILLDCERASHAL